MKTAAKRQKAAPLPGATLKLTFTADDLGIGESWVRAAAIVRELYDGKPVPLRAIMPLLGFQEPATLVALRRAISEGRVKRFEHPNPLKRGYLPA